MSTQSSTPVRVSTESRKSNAGRRLRAVASAIVESLEHRTLLSTTLAPTGDTFVRDNDYSLTNFGASPILFVKDASTGDNRISFLKFDLSGVSSINSAVLELSGALQTSTAAPATTGVFAVPTTNWIEGNGTIVDSVGDGFDTSNNPPGEMTWNNQPAISGSALASATVASSTFQTYTFDVTSYLQQQLAAGNTVVSLALENLQPTDQQTEFLSRESTSNVGSGPELLVTDNSAAASPSASISAPNVTSTSASSELVTVDYSGSAEINPATIDSSNIVVSPYQGGADLNVESLVSTTQNPDGSVTAAYTVDAPSGTWNSSNNGSYVVSVQPGTVQDVNGLGVTGAFGSFTVSVGDTIPPTASIFAPNVTAAGGSTYTFNVTYNDNVAVNVNSITLQNVSVSGPVGPLTLTSMTVNPSSNASQVVATYTAIAPNGSWAASDDGQYTITFNSNQVTDTAGNAAAGTSAHFNVSIAVPDTTPPTASVSAPNVSAPGGSTETVTVLYTDNVGIQASSISAGDLVVTSPSGTPLSVTGVTTSGSGQSVTATYTVAAPGGAWIAADNGQYAVNVPAGSVTDTSGNPVTAASGTFNVSAAIADTQPPAAAISAPAVVSAGGGTEIVTVHYTDNIGINLSSIGLGNLSVSGPGGPLTVTSDSVSGSGQSVTVAYTVQAPGSGWDASDDGTYNVAINANQVRDTSGNVAPVTLGSFAVNIALPNPTDPSFNGGNLVSAPFVAEATVTQPDGKILLVGHEITSGTSSEGVVERLNADGSVDTTFGNKGQIVTPTGNDEWFAVVIQGANHFVVAGTDNGDFALARYDFSGNLDPTFGSGGVELTDFGSSSDTAYAVALSPTGQIVTAGTSNDRFAFARYDANGALDKSFGEGGRQLFDTGATTQVLGALVVQNDGRIVAAGTSDANVEVMRLTADGEPDADFNSDGIVDVSGLTADTGASTPDYTVGVALQSDGKIVVAHRTTSGHFGIARLNTDGTLDTSFGVNGIATANFGGQDEADSVVIQGTGQIIAVGTSLQNGQPLTAVAAFDTNGNLISTFGENGMATFAAGTSTTTRELHIGQLALRAFGGSSTNGTVVVGTSSSGAGVQNVTSAIRRFQAPGSSPGAAIEEESRGVFGLVNNKRNTLTIDFGSGHKAIFSLSGNGNGMVLQNSAGDLHLEITANKAVSVTMRVIGGGTIPFTNISVTGNVNALHLPGSVISGTVAFSGSVGNLMLGDLQGSLTVAGALGTLTTGDLPGTVTVTGAAGHIKAGAVSGKIIVGGNITNLIAGDVSGEIYAGGNMLHARVGKVTGLLAVASTLTSLTATSLSGATVLAGATLPGGVLDLSGSTDTFGAGTIDNLRVNGAIASSFVGAGVNPTDGVFGDGDDTSAGASLIKTIFAKGGADSATHFEASAFGTAKLPAKVVVTTDPRFVVL
ncbi:MAG TPA: DNRLRE domain-containing protein [Tepidisphaeraceae bacterium]|nr:DNRLRE domain-containing protein [Tepidisphaeraceae bacterium]